MPEAVYAIGIEIAAARLPMLLVPLLSAVRAGRPCVLITRLGPEESPLKELMHEARHALAGFAERELARLQVLSAVGDCAVNLFQQGVEA